MLTLQKDNFFYENITPNHELPFRLLVHNTGDEHVVLRHWHKSFEISYTIRGENPNYYLNGRLFTQHTGDLVVVNPYEVHGLSLPKNPNRISMTIMLPDKFVRTTGYTSQYAIQNYISHTDKNFPRLKNLLEKLYLSTCNSNNAQLALQIGYGYLLFGLLIKNYACANKNTVTINRNISQMDYLKPVLDWIEKKHSQSISINDLAGVAHISVSYLAHIFKKQLQQTPLDYLTDVRLLHAQQLLLNSTHSIEIITELTGFSNEKSLTKAFKIKYQMTPHQYRLRHQSRI